MCFDVDVRQIHLLALVNVSIPFDLEDERSDNEMTASMKACSFEFDDGGWAITSDIAKDLVRHLFVLQPDDCFSLKPVLEHPVEDDDVVARYPTTDDKCRRCLHLEAQSCIFPPPRDGIWDEAARSVTSAMWYRQGPVWWSPMKAEEQIVSVGLLLSTLLPDR
ncbi:hypothetical protein PHYPSEUDO_006579 [Phytophthora pseudosyringae]|uniref:Uncharacterized protein n=1 Tax=Phytophthora pseudosyringae TaxID=221518 RepID=A0A8T1VIE4_9STRA|nr:hypothetical protein PHYPSEUDO_006579 [Phytophthora pseudosyringae]